MAATPSHVYTDGGGAILSGFDYANGLALKTQNLNGLVTLAQPFETSTWICLFFSTLTVAVIYSIREILSVPINKKALFFNFWLRSTNYFASLAATLLGVESRIFRGFSIFRITQRILNCFWISVILSIPAFYSSFIFAKIVSRPLFYVDSFEDIAKLPEIELVLWKGSTFGCSVICPKIAKDFPELWSHFGAGKAKIRNLPQKELNSKKSFDDVLDGNRVVFQSVSSISRTLSKRIKNRHRCGFYISRIHYKNLLTMLFNKNLKVEIRNVVNKK